ncbi:MAG: monofunctional biosynthetic peptidoglycan transglycosylase [Bacteroidia bacterium]|nr:monofunctional biosynthetic peptidoglycan transglycosylase [Bacteroidia bacterium]
MLWLLGLVLLWVILLKFIPVPFTLTMFFQSMNAYWKGEDPHIYYEWVSYGNISDHVKVAVVASEDQRFPTHSGIDFAAVAQAIKENQSRKRPRGASTISQQVAKNVFLWQGGGFIRKALEIPFTYLIELIWGKQRILEVYLNIAEMGPQIFGVQAASIRFFNKRARQLAPVEAATLAAVLPNPKVYSARQPSWYIIQRRGQIMYQMQMLGGYQYLKDLRRF